MNIAVYCSAKDAIPEEYLALGTRLGEWIAASGHTLVYGGATGGLMTRVSQAAADRGAKVIGVISQRIIRSGRRADNCTEMIEVDNLCERKRQMRRLSDCFVALPGSVGTLDEMFDVISSGTIWEHVKPLFVLNYKGFYNHLIAELDHMRQLAFIPAEESYKPVFVDTVEELTERLAALSPLPDSNVEQ